MNAVRNGVFNHRLERTWANMNMWHVSYDSVRVKVWRGTASPDAAFIRVGVWERVRDQLEERR